MTDLLPGKKGLEKGQAVLVVLLVMSVLLTLGLSTVSRSVTDVKISQQSQESARAFWTAQAGLEKALLTQEETSGVIGGVDYTVTKTGLGGTEEFIFPEEIPQGESVVYWLVDHNPDGSIGSTFYSGSNLTIYWGDSGDTDTALIVTLIYKDASGTFQSRKFAFDPSTIRVPATGFGGLVVAGGSLGTTAFAHNATIPILPLPNLPYFANIRMIFNTSPQILGVETEANYPGPVQGSCFESTATVAVSNIVRKLRECRTWPRTPGIFDYLLFSGGSI